MQTTVTERGQVSIPSAIRKKFRLEPGSGIEWIVTSEGIYLFPVPKDPIAAFRGKGTKGLSKLLLDERQKDRLKENRRWNATFSTPRR